jgi:hypothetical protein
MKTQKEFLEWTKQNLGFSKSTTYEYIISYRIYSEIASKIPPEFRPPMYQSHCQLLSKVPQDKLVDTWVDVCRQAPNGVITTAFLELYLDRHNLRAKNGRAVGGSGDILSPAASVSEAPTKSLKRSATASEEFPERADGEEDESSFIDPEQADLSQAPSSSASSAHNEPYASSVVVRLASTEAAIPTSSSSASNAASTHTGAQLPVNEGLIFELSKNVVVGNQFEMVLQCVDDFRAAENRLWFGRVWANLTSVRPLTTSSLYAPPSTIEGSGFEGGLEHLLRIIFTKFASKEFSEGLFLLRAEFGADWFTPILQHPYCVLRHTNPPVAAPSTLKSSGKRLKRSSSTALLANALPPFESYVMFYLGPNIKDFCHVFRSIGLVPGINSW